MRTFDLISAEAVCRELGARIKNLRLARNLSQQQLADMVAGSLSSVRRLETCGQASALLLVRVSQALQVVDQLSPLFVEEVQTIAQAERAALALRQRARLPRRVRGNGVL
jgi:transcriptional regulator with XRE-family HTH domain